MRILPSDFQVVEAETEDYPEVQDLLRRFKTLKDANKDLTEAQAKGEEETERLRAEFSSYTKERQGKHTASCRDITKSESRETK